MAQHAIAEMVDADKFADKPDRFLVHFRSEGHRGILAFEELDQVRGTVSQLQSDQCIRRMIRYRRPRVAEALDQLHLILDWWARLQSGQGRLSDFGMQVEQGSLCQSHTRPLPLDLGQHLDQNQPHILVFSHQKLLQGGDRFRLEPFRFARVGNESIPQQSRVGPGVVQAG